jgi:hypothetical protein
VGADLCTSCCAVVCCGVQPALYEAFGLTVIEAMTCGLPTFATCNGGPSEIIKNGKSGFHIDPYHGAAVSDSADPGGCGSQARMHGPCQLILLVVGVRRVCAGCSQGSLVGL